MRIIAGTLRGRIIEAPPGLDTRPTLDRVREAIFGSIQFTVPGARVLDLFAGSGAMGIEALSRGAAFAAFNDASSDAARVVTGNLNKLGLASMAKVYCLDCRAAAAEAAKLGPFDIVFLDPPYGAGILGEAMGALLGRGILADGALITAEHAHSAPPETPPGYILRTRRKYGVAAVSFFGKAE